MPPNVYIEPPVFDGLARKLIPAAKNCAPDPTLELDKVSCAQLPDPFADGVNLHNPEGTLFDAAQSPANTIMLPSMSRIGVYAYEAFCARKGNEDETEDDGPPGERDDFVLNESSCPWVA